MSDMISLTRVRYQPRSLSARTSENGMWVPARRLSMVLFALIWLPAGFCFLSAATGDLRWPVAANSWISLAMLAAGGLPLVAACHRLALNRYPGAAWAAGIVLGAPLLPLSLATGWHEAAEIAVCAAVASVPVWIAALCLGHRTRTGFRRRTPGAPMMVLSHGTRSVR